MMASPPVDHYVPNEACIVQAAAYYGANPHLIRGVLSVEHGRPGLIGFNKDGSFDMGPMRVNSVHLPELEKYGITQAMLTNNECLNIHIGTYYLQKEVIKARGKSPAAFWEAVGNYHSKTPVLNQRYQYRVWNQVLAQRNEVVR